MVDVRKLIETARAEGCVLVLDGEKVLFTPPKYWSKDARTAFLATLRANRQEIVAFLVAESMPRAERLSDLAACGKDYCAGCYLLASGVYLHPPKGAAL